MFAELMSWVKQMVCLVIFLTMALQILPDQRYVKYIRFFCGTYPDRRTDETADFSSWDERMGGRDYLTDGRTESGGYGLVRDRGGAGGGV